MPLPITIIIQGHSFETTLPYSEGHVIDAAEAGVLNQTWVENIRANFAKRVPQGANGEMLEDLRDQFKQYVEAYEFRPRGAIDPIEREASRLARAKAGEWLNAKGLKQSELPEGRWDKMIESLKAHPSIRGEAKRRVEALQSVAESVFGEGTSEVIA